MVYRQHHIKQVEQKMFVARPQCMVAMSEKVRCLIQLTYDAETCDRTPATLRVGSSYNYVTRGPQNKMMM